MKTNHEAGSTQKGNVASKLLYNVWSNCCFSIFISPNFDTGW
jgi:hypothetical protein